MDSGVGEGADDITTVYSDNKQNGRLVGIAYAEKMGDAPIDAILLSGAKGNVAGAERDKVCSAESSRREPEFLKKRLGNCRWNSTSNS